MILSSVNLKDIGNKPRRLVCYISLSCNTFFYFDVILDIDLFCSLPDLFTTEFRPFYNLYMFCFAVSVLFS